MGFNCRIYGRELSITVFFGSVVVVGGWVDGWWWVVVSGVPRVVQKNVSTVYRGVTKVLPVFLAVPFVCRQNHVFQTTFTTVWRKKVTQMFQTRFAVLKKRY